MEGETKAYNIDLVKERVPNTVIISVLFVLGLFGNSTYLFSMINTDKKLTSIRYFSVVLSIIDLIGIISGSILGILKNTYVVTFQSDFACKALWYISSCAALLSSLVITMMAIEKCRRIVRVFSSPFTKKSRFIAVVSLSGLVVIVTIPVILLNGKRPLNIIKESVNVTHALDYPITNETDVTCFTPSNLTMTLQPFYATNVTSFSPGNISDVSGVPLSNVTFMTGFSCCVLDSKNEHLRVLKAVYDITVLVTVIVSLVIIVYAYIRILKVVLEHNSYYRRNIAPSKEKKHDIYISIKHSGLHGVGWLRFYGFEEEISEKSVNCAYNIPIKAVSQLGRFMPSETICGCCLPSSKSGRSRKVFKMVITIITLFLISYIPSASSMLFEGHHSDTSWLHASAFRLNLFLTIRRSYLLAHALNPYVSIYLDNFIRIRFVELVSRLCR